MKNHSRIFILVLFLLAFLASLAWVGVRYLTDVLHEFNRVATVDLVLMETATTLNDLQLKKEIIFARLSSSAEELAFGQANEARSQYLHDYIKGISEEFDNYILLSDRQLGRIQGLSGLSPTLQEAFAHLGQQTADYDTTVQGIFKAVEHGGFQLSLDDLDNVDSRQKDLTGLVQSIVNLVWRQVHSSMEKSRHWRKQGRIIFAFSILLTVTLTLLVFAYKGNLDALAAQKKDLEKLNKELDRFVHTVSHDIAGPLTTIVGYAAYLENHYSRQLDDKGRDCISGVRKGATRLSVLIKDMLELTKMTRVKNPYSRVSMQAVVEAALANCDFMVKQTSAVIEVDKKMPEIVCDRIKTTAVFFNLINNALKFAKPGQPPVIKIGWNETAEGHEFYVKDNGMGIDAAHHKDIFELFKRLPSAEQHAGSGVGLAIVKAAVEDQGGRIRVESTPGQGTAFIFTIPKNLIAAKPLYSIL